jgi:hypothetical protein
VQVEQVVLQILHQQITALSMVLTHGSTLHQPLLQSVAVPALDMHMVMERFQIEPVPMEVMVVVELNMARVVQADLQHKLCRQVQLQNMEVMVVQLLQVVAILPAQEVEVLEP